MTGRDRRRRGARPPSVPIVTPGSEVMEIESDLDIRRLQQATTSDTYARGSVRVGTTW